MSQVIPFPPVPKISSRDLDNIKVAVEKAIMAHHVLQTYLDEIQADPRLSYLEADELIEILAVMLNQKEKQN
ncbi:MAG: hypothetical protein OEX19_15165 [Gammaproteobacteria bacterium]|nr:hypothetical protein [Gammaproteobacteria bacterium]